MAANCKRSFLHYLTQGPLDCWSVIESTIPLDGRDPQHSGEQVGSGGGGTLAVTHAR